MRLDEIHLRDPFILAENGVYYLYGSRCTLHGTYAFQGKGLDVYQSADLIHWSEPTACFTRPDGFWADRDFWAPEVHAYRSGYYMLVSLKSATRRRATQILRSDSPTGPFLPISDRPVTPADWECLDGTLYIDKTGQPFIVFCHEWVQIQNGTICAMPLRDDLTAPVGEPFQLFSAADAPWVRSMTGEGNFITDGPFLRRNADGNLWMLWSSYAAPGRYALALAESESGEITGPWRHPPAPFFDRDGGHGMLFTGFDGTLYLLLHRPNRQPLERPCLLPVRESPTGYTPLPQKPPKR